MNTADIADPLFRRALVAIDAGELETLSTLLDSQPLLTRQRLDIPKEGYFRQPYLLWFVAYNPIRTLKIPQNIIALASTLIQAIRRQAADTLSVQLDYALSLVATGRIVRDAGVQPALIDLLIDAGAEPGNGIDALAHGNPDAAGQLIRRGGKLGLATAAGLGLDAEIALLIPSAGKDERQLAMVVAAFCGRSDLLPLLIGPDIDLDAFPDKQTGFHTHATALHQAVWSGSLAAVKLLVTAGADTGLKDRLYQGTPLEWAEFRLHDQISGEEEKESIRQIVHYLNLKK